MQSLRSSIVGGITIVVALLLAMAVASGRVVPLAAAMNETPTATTELPTITTELPTATRIWIEAGDPPPTETPMTPTEVPPVTMTDVPTATAIPTEHVSSLDVDVGLSQSTLPPGGSLTAGLVVRAEGTRSQYITVEGGVDSALVLTSISGGDCTSDDQLLRCIATIEPNSPLNVTIGIRARQDAPPGRWAVSFIVEGPTVTKRVRSSVTITAPATSTPTDAPQEPTIVPALPTDTPVIPATLPSTATRTTSSATPTAIGTLPDACEENDRLTQPCALPSEATTSDLNFVDDNRDVFSVLLKDDRQYTIRAESDNGIDPFLTLYQAGSLDTSVAANDDVQPGSSAAEVQITTAGAEGWYLVQVENKAPGDMRGRTYRLSVRSAARPNEPLPTTTTIAVETTQQRGDAFENNYSLETAKYLAWGVPYDLSLRCPEPDACISGDHDFFRVPVKAGIPFVALTYDLGPGADTTIALYKPVPGMIDPATGLQGWQLLQHNDDVVAGRTLRSQMLFVPDWSGEALLIVAPSERREVPDLPSAIGPTGRYRLIAGGADLPAIVAIVAAQSEIAAPAATLTPSAGVPVSSGGGSSIVGNGEGNGTALLAPTVADTPTVATAPTMVAAPTAAALETTDEEEIIREACLSGAALVQSETADFYAAAVPRSQNRLMATYPKGALITLLGSCYLGWVKVQPQGAVTPGWMFAGDLMLVEGGDQPLSGTIVSATPEPASSTPRPVFQSTPTPAASVASLPNTQGDELGVSIEPAPAAVDLPTSPRTTQRVTVTIRDTQGVAWSGGHVQLVSVLGNLITEGLTQADGTLTLTAEVNQGVAVFVQVPVFGLRASVRGSAMTITTPPLPQ